jgi:polyhydroxybutyrate depolymerase
MAAPRGTRLAVDLVEGSMDVGGLARTWRLAPATAAGAPLLVALHGAGGTGLGMAALSGLAGRGPAAGFTVVFPDGWNRVWNDRRNAPGLARREAVDDVGFLQALVERLAADGVADPGNVSAVGMSNGGFLAEHLARHGLLPLRAVAIVAASATLLSRQQQPQPAAPATVLLFAGTADPLVPYAGGPIGPGRGRGRGGRSPGAGRGIAVGVEIVAADWAAANGLPATPAVERLAVAGTDLPVTLVRWQRPGRPPVLLHRVEGGGHTWPGGAQYLPERLVGRRSTGLDATGILLATIGGRPA